MKSLESILTKTAEAWADFDKEKELRGAVDVLYLINRADLAEVMIEAWAEQKSKRK